MVAFLEHNVYLLPPETFCCVLFRPFFLYSSGYVPGLFLGRFCRCYRTAVRFIRTCILRTAVLYFVRSNIIRAKRVCNCYIPTKKSVRVSCRVSCVRLIIFVPRGSLKRYCCRTLRQVGYRKVAWMLFPNSCRCSAGGETIRLSSQSSRVRYSAPLFFSCFFSCFFFLYFFLYFFSMGGGILCMYVPFFLCNTPPACNHHRRPPRCPNAQSTQCTHASSGRPWAAGST